MPQAAPDFSHLGNGFAFCTKGHRHLSTSWSIYAVDPELAYKEYDSALKPMVQFDTKEDTENLYSLSCFSKPFGPPSWSMVIPGGAIAVFQGGKYGFPLIKPEWEDPAAANGSEFRFVFSENMDALKVIDRAFQSLVVWMTENPVYDGTYILGLFAKNTDRMESQKLHNIQFRIWTSEIPKSKLNTVAQKIGQDISVVLGLSGARGTLNYRSLNSLIKRANNGQPNDEERPNTPRENTPNSMNTTRAFRLRLMVPPNPKDSANGKNGF